MAGKSLNFDMDVVKKHRFWFMLGGAVLFTGVCMYTLSTSAVEQIEAKHKQINQNLELIRSTNNAVFYNADNLKAEDEKLEKTKKAETDTWEAGFKEQEKLQTWPKQIEDRFKFRDGNFVTEIEVLPAQGNYPDEPNKIHGKLKDITKEYIDIEPATKGATRTRFYLTADLNSNLSDTKTGNKVPILGLADLAKEKGNLVRLAYYTSRRFNDKLNAEESFDFRTHYRSQILPIIELVEPVTKAGTGKVQLANWLYEDDKTLPPPGADFFTWVAQDWSLNNDFSEEAWIAQEDLWIQREIYQSIRDANDSLARFEDMEPGKGAKRTSYKFRNFYYELDLSLNGSVLKAQVKNLLNRRQRFYFDLSIAFHAPKAGAPKPSTVHLEGLFLDPKGKKDDTREATVNLTLDRPAEGIFQVMQVLTPESVAVRSLDKVLIGYSDDQLTSHSHRTFDKLIRLPSPEKGNKNDPNSGGADPMPMPMDPPPPMPPEQPMPQQGGRPAAPIAGRPLYVKSFERYMKVTEAIRRVPVAVVMTVDQYQIDRVLTAFMNSRIRFLITQTLVQRDSKDASRPPIIPGLLEGKGNPNLPAPSGADFDSNVELSIYGIYSLYERYPRVPNIVYPDRR